MVCRLARPYRATHQHRLSEDGNILKALRLDPRLGLTFGKAVGSSDGSARIRRTVRRVHGRCIGIGIGGYRLLLCKGRESDCDERSSQLKFYALIFLFNRPSVLDRRSRTMHGISHRSGRIGFGRRNLLVERTKRGRINRKNARIAGVCRMTQLAARQKQNLVRGGLLCGRLIIQR